MPFFIRSTRAALASSFTGMEAIIRVQANGAMMLELKAEGKASMTFMGDTKQCTYTVKEKQIPVVCAGDTMEFTVHDDGSLTGPPGGFVPILKKSEKK